MPKLKAKIEAGAAIRAQLLAQAKDGGLKIARQLARVGDGGDALLRVQRRIAALESGEPVEVSGFELGAALHAAGASRQEARRVELEHVAWIVAPTGEYEENRPRVSARG